MGRQTSRARLSVLLHWYSTSLTASRFPLKIWATARWSYSVRRSYASFERPYRNVRCDLLYGVALYLVYRALQAMMRPSHMNIFLWSCRTRCLIIHLYIHCLRTRYYRDLEGRPERATYWHITASEALQWAATSSLEWGTGKLGKPSRFVVHCRAAKFHGMELCALIKHLLLQQWASGFSEMDDELPVM